MKNMMSMEVAGHFMSVENILSELIKEECVAG